MRVPDRVPLRHVSNSLPRVLEKAISQLSGAAVCVAKDVFKSVSVQHTGLPALRVSSSVKTVDEELRVAPVLCLSQHAVRCCRTCIIVDEKTRSSWPPRPKRAMHVVPTFAAGDAVKLVANGVRAPDGEYATRVSAFSICCKVFGTGDFARFFDDVPLISCVVLQPRVSASLPNNRLAAEIARLRLCKQYPGFNSWTNAPFSRPLDPGPNPHPVR